MIYSIKKDNVEIVNDKQFIDNVKTIITKTAKTVDFETTVSNYDVIVVRVENKSCVCAEVLWFSIAEDDTSAYFAYNAIKNDSVNNTDPNKDFIIANSYDWYDESKGYTDDAFLYNVFCLNGTPPTKTELSEENIQDIKPEEITTVVSDEYEIKVEPDKEIKTYGDGAIRQDKSGKGRPDLIPPECLMRVFDEFTLKIGTVVSKPREIINNVYTGNYITPLIDLAMLKYNEGIMETEEQMIHIFGSLIKELSIHYEKGAEKYGIDNWKKGLPAESFKQSALRHFNSYYLMHEKDENHFIAFVWNVFGYIYCMINK